MSLWKPYVDACAAGDRRWLPCTEDFYHDMLGVVPPAWSGMVPGLGWCYANGEPWSEDRYLWCRAQGDTYEARLASFEEFFAEAVAMLPAGWIPVTAEQQAAILRATGGDAYQSEPFRLSFVLQYFGPNRCLHLPIAMPGHSCHTLWRHPETTLPA